MSGAPFAIDPALASNNNSTTTPATASPANLSKSPDTNPNQNQNGPPSPPKQPNPGYYSILPSLPPVKFPIPLHSIYILGHNSFSYGNSYPDGVRSQVRSSTHPAR
ncbi:hypothetical protein FRC12_012819 [Ceratobasidium sp. 428]|nr:hypothetical protein FRC12_012819 [Ceratobasidium sp. 428]